MRERLEDLGYEVIEAKNCSQAIGLMQSCNVAMMIIDSATHDYKSAAPLTARNITASNTPCVLLVESRKIKSISEGFNADLDDYLLKPLRFADLDSCIKGIFKPNAWGTKLTIGNVTLCSVTNTMTVDNISTKLTAKQMRVLLTLAKHSPRVINKQSFSETLYPPEMKINQPIKAVEALVFRLRNRLRELDCNVRIRTVRGCGYKISTSRGINLPTAEASNSA